jgi:hypothetical protein
VGFRRRRRGRLDRAESQRDVSITTGSFSPTLRVLTAPGGPPPRLRASWWATRRPW